jgi:hypothetical protein
MSHGLPRQVTEGTNTDIFWIGQMLVAANPLLV